MYDYDYRKDNQEQIRIDMSDWIGVFTAPWHILGHLEPRIDMNWIWFLTSWNVWFWQLRDLSDMSIWNWLND